MTGDTGAYSPTILAHFRRPRNYGTLPNATAEAEGVNPLCGDRIRIAVVVDDQSITEARFTANACAICVAAASLLTEHLQGMSVRSATRLQENEILALVGDGVPTARRKCATLPLTALHRALTVGRSAGRPNRSMISAILLAAGNAHRFDGAQKLLARVPHERQDLPLVRVAALGVLGAKLERVVVVLGREAEHVRDALALLPLAFVQNGEYASGMSSSIRTGVVEASRLWTDSEGLLVALGDQPMGGTGIIERLASAFVELGPRRTHFIVAPRFHGIPGNPVIFGRELVPELLAITGDRGARLVVERDASRVMPVDFSREQPLDVDTREDLDSLRRETHDS